jgi:DNA-binding MarR family transcriptional regulator
MASRPLKTLAEAVERDLRAIREIVRRPTESEIAKGELTGPQQSAMAALVRSEGMSIRELRMVLGLAHSTTSGILDRLERRGMIERRRDAADARLTRIFVTPVVREFVRTTLPGLSVHPLEEALRRAKPAQREAVVTGLRTLRTLLENR